MHHILITALFCFGQLAFAGSNPDEAYRSRVDLSRQIYSNEAIGADLTALAQAFPDRLQVLTIGQSVQGRPIYAAILGNRINPKHRLLLIGNMHAREIHSAQILVKQIEHYLQTWTQPYQEETPEAIFADVALYIVPGSNPDGNAIVFDGLRHLANGQNDWDGGQSIPATSPDRTERISRIKQAILRNAHQVIQRGEPEKPTAFRARDLVLYKANANGVDLHYNFYESGVNEAYVRAFVPKKPQTFTTQPFSSEGYIGAAGIDQPESRAIRDFIERHHLTEGAVTYHARMPAIMYDYSAGWSPKDPARLAGFAAIAKRLALLSSLPLHTTANGPIGISGWYAQKYRALSLTIETGYTRFNGRNDHCPLPVDQLSTIWREQRLVTLELARLLRLQGMAENRR